MKKIFLKTRSTFYCFTPEVSLATFLIEFILAIYTLFVYKLTKFNRIVVLLLLMLGLFQLAEYMVCKSTNSVLWGQIGATSITLLPVLGLQLTSYMTQKNRLVILGYILCAGFIFAIFFLSYLSNFRCSNTFVSIQYENPNYSYYGFYYFGLLLLTMGILVKNLYNKNIYKKAIWSMLIGYLSFIIPTIMVFVFSTITLYAVPSIMCGFALLFAIILVFKVTKEFNKVNFKK